MSRSSLHPGPILAMLLATLPELTMGASLAAGAEVVKPAAGTFLVARRGMPDPRFAHAVILLVDYGPDGALGLIVNRPTRAPLSEAFPQLDALEDSAQTLWFGGPVAAQQAVMLVNTREAPAASHTVMESLHFSTDLRLLESMHRSTGSDRVRVYAGYSGWAPSQLDGELARGDWQLRAASVEQVFATDTSDLWESLIGASGTWVRARRPWLPAPGLVAGHSLRDAF